jgi:anti-sigma regulatory factor (Ser/Thr protein kinase)
MRRLDERAARVPDVGRERPDVTVSESHDLPASADSIAVARSIVLRLGEQLPDKLRDDAALLVSELMSNVVRHGGDLARLTVSAGPDSLRIAVHDDGAGAPTMRAGAIDPTAASGRGLRIVDTLARRWGVDPDPDGAGKTVWFELVVAAEMPSRQTSPAADAAGVTQVSASEDRRVWN